MVTPNCGWWAAAALARGAWRSALAACWASFATAPGGWSGWGAASGLGGCYAASLQRLPSAQSTATRTCVGL